MSFYVSDFFASKDSSEESEANVRPRCERLPELAGHVRVSHRRFHMVGPCGHFDLVVFGCTWLVRRRHASEMDDGMGHGRAQEGCLVCFCSF